MHIHTRYLKRLLKKTFPRFRGITKVSVNNMSEDEWEFLSVASSVYLNWCLATHLRLIQNSAMYRAG